MLSKCANPTCSAGFRYLRQGRIFNLEVSPICPNGDVQVSHKIEHFWLCDSCAGVMEVVWENGVVSTQPLRAARANAKSDPKVLAMGASS